MGGSPELTQGWLGVVEDASMRCTLIAGFQYCFCRFGQITENSHILYSSKELATYIHWQMHPTFDIKPTRVFTRLSNIQRRRD